MSSLIDDYLALETLLIDRLTDQVPALDEALSAADLDGITDAQVNTPSAHVIYLGDLVPEGAKFNSGCSQIVDQRWLVWVVVRNLRTTITGADNRADAGPLLVTINAALQGWKASPEFGELKRITPPAVRYRNGNGYFPLAYKARITSRGVTP